MGSPDTVAAFSKNALDEVVRCQYPIVLYWLPGATGEFIFDLERAPALTKYMQDAQKRLDAGANGGK